MIAAMPALLEEMCSLASRLAVEAGAIALDRCTTRVVSRKQDHSVVTDVDHAVQSHLLSAIASAFPDHGIWAEEKLLRSGVHADPADATYVWAVDPIDGTRNYVAGFPVFATSIGVLDHGLPVVGVIREHRTGDPYAARTGGGATCNGRPIRVRETAEHGDLLLGIASGKDALTVSVVQHWAAQPGYVLRNTGSTAVNMALVAAGCLAGAFGKRVKLWDIAAGSVLVREAGGTVTDPFGESLVPFSLEADHCANVPYLASAPGIHSRLVESIRCATRAD